MLLQHLRRITRATPEGEDDARLLARYAASRDGAAFETLVRRHGPMVLGVCRRVLNDSHLADDAFQAVFLVLIRKAASLRRPQLLASWLYGVAYRTALKARSLDARRKAQETREVQMLAAPVEHAWHDLRPVLDEELSRLPEKYRAPVVLCYLQGHTNEDAARQLGWTKGTVSGRLARARELLHRRLARRGISLSGAALSATVAANASAAVSPELLSALTRAAAASTITAASLSPPAVALAQGVLNSMLMNTVKNVLIGIALLLIVGVGGALLFLELRASMQERVPVAVAGLVPIDRTEGLEAQVLKAQKVNRARFTRGVLRWNFDCKVDGFAEPDQKYETHGVFELWWDGDRLATRNSYDQAVVDPFGQFGIRRRGERTAWDGKLFRRMPNEKPEADAQNIAQAWFKHLEKSELGLRPSYRHYENWFDIIGWSQVSRFTMLHASRDPEQRPKMKKINWSTADGPSGTEGPLAQLAHLTVEGETGSRSIDCYDLARGGELTRIEWFDDKGRPYLKRIVTLKKIDDGWFPVDVDSRSIEPANGKVTLHQHFKLDLEKSRFNRGAVVPAGVFTLPPADALDDAGKP